MDDEEEKLENIELSGGDSFSDVDLKVGTSGSEHISTVNINIADVVGSYSKEGGVDSESRYVDDGMFEQVSLDKDKEKIVGDSESSNARDLDNLTSSSGGNEETCGVLVKGVTVESDSSPAVVQVHQDGNASNRGSGVLSPYLSEQSSARSSYESPLYAYRDGGNSPIGSPRKPKPKPVPNVSPELLHLVDSVIMGKPESMESLKNIISGVESFGNGQEAESIALLVVDSLLATMGGVESFEEEEDNNHY